MTVTGIAREMGIPKASAYQIVATLLGKRILVKEERSGELFLGPRLSTFGRYARTNLDVVRIAARHLESLNELVDETIHLTIVRDDEVRYVDCAESTKRLRTRSSVGEICDVHCTAVGKSVLAFQSERERQRLLARRPLKRFTENTIVDPVRLSEALNAVARDGYAVDNIEHEEGVRCVGAPVRNHDGAVIGAISVSGPSARISEEREPYFARAVMETAAEISRNLGFRPPQVDGLPQEQRRNRT